MTIGIVGYGVVGKALARLFGNGGGSPSLRMYDKYLDGMNDDPSGFPPAEHIRHLLEEARSLARTRSRLLDRAHDVTEVGITETWVKAKRHHRLRQARADRKFPVGPQTAENWLAVKREQIAHGGFHSPAK